MLKLLLDQTDMLFLATGLLHLLAETQKTKTDPKGNQNLHKMICLENIKELTSL